MYRIFLGFRWLASRPIGIITMIGIWLSVTATIVTIAVMTGFLAYHEELARGTTADLVVTPRAQRASDGSIAAPTEYAAFAPILSKVDGVERASPRLVRPGLIKFDHLNDSLVLGDRRYVGRNFVRIFGIDPDLDGGAASFRDHLDLPPGWEFDPNRPDDSPRDAEVDDKAKPFRIDPKHLPIAYRNARLPVALLGSDLFVYFGVRKGSRINLVTVPDDAVAGEAVKPLSETFVIGGVVRTGNKEVDNGSIYLDLSRARKFMRAPSGYSEVCVELEPNRDLEAARRQLVDALAAAGVPAEVETWRERGKRLLDAVATERSIIGVLLFFFLIVACFNVLSTLTILVTDKIRDIGVLSALGAKPSGIQSIFVVNGFLMALIGGALGVHHGIGLTQALNPINDWCAERFGVSLFPKHVFAFDAIPYQFVPAIIVGTFVATIVLALLCAWIPARRAARFDPVEALRYE